MAKLNASVFADEEIAINIENSEAIQIGDHNSQKIDLTELAPEIDNSDWVDVDDDIFAIDEQPQPTSEPESTNESTEGQNNSSVDNEHASTDTEIRGSVEDTVSSDAGDSTSVEPAGEVSQPAEPEMHWDEAAERRNDELTFFERLKELNDAIERAKENLNDAKEQAKLAKDTLSVAVAQLQNFAAKGVQYRTKPVPKIVVDRSVDHPSPTQTPTPPTTANAPAETEWRAWETASILDGIEGLGAKKRDLLIEHFPTFGKLMDAREEAGKEHVSFHSLLPKGIGETIGTEIINRMDAKIVPGM